MLKKLIKNIKLIIGGVMGKERQVPLLGKFMSDDVEVYVALDEDLLTFKNVMFGLVQQRSSKQIAIYVDQNYLHSDSYTREFILAHELGHFNCGHFKDKHNVGFLNAFLRPIRAGLNHVDSKEIEADAYAVELIGITKVIHGITYISTQLPHNAELRKRLQIVLDAVK